MRLRAARQMLSGAAVHQLEREVAAVAKQEPSDFEDLEADNRRALLGMSEGFSRSGLDNYNMLILMDVLLHFRLTQNLLAGSSLLLYALLILTFSYIYKQIHTNAYGSYSSCTFIVTGRTSRI